MLGRSPCRPGSAGQGCRGSEVEQMVCRPAGTEGPATEIGDISAGLPKDWAPSASSHPSRESCTQAIQLGEICPPIEPARGRCSPQINISRTGTKRLKAGLFLLFIFLFVCPRDPSR